MRKKSLPVPQCDQCAFAKVCAKEGVERKSLFCLSNHYSGETVRDYMLQWDEGRMVLETPKVMKGHRLGPWQE